MDAETLVNTAVVTIRMLNGVACSNGKRLLYCVYILPFIIRSVQWAGKDN